MKITDRAGTEKCAPDHFRLYQVLSKLAPCAGGRAVEMQSLQTSTARANASDSQARDGLKCLTALGFA
jgi:hypothetical protein